MHHGGIGTTSQALLTGVPQLVRPMGLELKIIAAILERTVIEKILTHLGLDPQPPPRGRAREARQDFAA